MFSCQGVFIVMWPCSCVESLGDWTICWLIIVWDCSMVFEMMAGACWLLTLILVEWPSRNFYRCSLIYLADEL